MIIIHQPKVERIDGKSRLTAVLDIEGQLKDFWLEVEQEYEKYLCHERSDAFLVAALPFAMRKGYDITCTAPVTNELLYNLVNHLLPALCNSSDSLRLPNISCECTDEELINYGGVGTGMSCGIDSFHAVMEHLNPSVGGEKFKLTHLCVFDVGSFAVYEKKLMGSERIKSAVFSRAKRVADDLGLPLICTNSNIRDVLFLDIAYYFEQVLTWNNVFGILALQKLWNTYYLGTGYPYHQFTLTNAEKDSPLYELLSLNCFSTRGLRIYPEGGAFDRIEKINNIADFPAAQKHLHICFHRDYNDGVCDKCRRTLLASDLLGKLDRFSESLPIEYYKANRIDYLLWLVKNAVLNKDLRLTPIYEQMMQRGIYHKELEDICNLLKTDYIESPKSEPNPDSPPKIHANCAVVIDVGTGEVFFEKNADLQEIAADTIKIITCINALEHGNLYEKIAMPETAKFGNSSIIPAGEAITLRDLLYGMMVSSYHDCALAVALTVSGSVESFVAKMNELAKRIGMSSSYITTPHGIHEIGDRTTARDIAIAMRYALGNQTFRELINTPVYNFKEYKFESNNALIHQKVDYIDRKYPFCTGGVYGRSGGRYVFASAANKDGREFIFVQLAITHGYGLGNCWSICFKDAVLMYEWIFQKTYFCSDGIK